MTLAQHLSISNEHYTPEHVVRLSRRVLGDIDLDPASCEAANSTVQATRYIGLPDDGLALDWRGIVFLNPPGGRTPKQWKDVYRTQSNATAWWRKLTEEHKAGRVEQAIFIGFTLEILRSAQGQHWPHPFDHSLCVPRERLCFGGKDQPTHANVIVYLGGNQALFSDVFSELGRVKL